MFFYQGKLVQDWRKQRVRLNQGQKFLQACGANDHTDCWQENHEKDEVQNLSRKGKREKLEGKGSRTWSFLSGCGRDAVSEKGKNDGLWSTNGMLKYQN